MCMNTNSKNHKVHSFCMSYKKTIDRGLKGKKIILRMDESSNNHPVFIKLVEVSSHLYMSVAIVFIEITGICTPI